MNKLVNWRIFWSIIFSIFLYVGIENSFALWTPLFLVKIRGVSTTIASYYISIFWFVMIGGRWFFGKFSYKANLCHSLIVGAAVGALFIVFTFLSKERSLILLFIACSVLLLSYIYPNIIALGGNIFPNSIGFVTGILTASGFAGSVFFPWLIGPVSQAMGLTKSGLQFPC